MPQVETSDPQKSAQNTALFVECVTMYTHQAMIGMGKVVNPVTKKAERNLDVARLFIDMLEMLQERTSGNLTGEESRFLTHVLTELRLNYVAEVEDDEKKAAGGGA